MSDLREDVAKAIWDATESEPWSSVGPLGRRFVFSEADAALEATADWIAERWGDQHPGALAIRSALSNGK